MLRDDRTRPPAAPHTFGSVAVVVGGKRLRSAAPPPPPTSRPLQPPPIPRAARPSPAARPPEPPPVPRQALVARQPPPSRQRMPSGGGAVSRAAAALTALARSCLGVARTVTDLRKADRMVIVVTHRPTFLEAVNMALLIRSGRMIAFSPDDQVFRQVARAADPGAGDRRAIGSAPGGGRPSSPARDNTGVERRDAR